MCVLREDHPAAMGRKLTVKQFCALDHALVSYDGGGFRGVTDDALEQLGKRRSVTLSVKSFLILPDILRASDMVAILPSRLVAGMDKLAISPAAGEDTGVHQDGCLARTHPSRSSTSLDTSTAVHFLC